MTQSSATRPADAQGHNVQFKVRFGELDPYGHVNHAMYFSYLEFGRTEALAFCGLALDQIAVNGFQLVVTHVDVRFRQAAGPNDLLVVDTRIGQVKRASAIWRQRISRRSTDLNGVESDQLLVTAEITTAVTGSDGRPTRPPPWLFENLAPLVVQQLGVGEAGASEVKAVET